MSDGSSRSIRPRSVPTRRGAVVALSTTLLLLGALTVLAVGCTTEDDTVASSGTSYRGTLKPATTVRRTISSQASEEFDRAISDLGSTSSVAPSTTLASTTTSRLSTTTSSGPAGSGSPSTTAAVTVETCKLFSQVIAFAANAQNLIDPNDAQVTATQLAEPVAKSKAGLDQLQQLAPAEIKGDVDTVIAWLRGLAAASSVDNAAAGVSLDNMRVWFAVHCRTAT